MADVFISYKREDLERVRQIVACLEADGLSVWYDEALDSGRTFTEAIQGELNTAGCVLVVWSKSSVTSRWVNAEAHFGLERLKLVACKIEDCEPMAPFNIVHHTDLTAWRGACEDESWVRLLGSIRKVLSGEAPTGLSGAQNSETFDRINIIHQWTLFEPVDSIEEKGRAVYRRFMTRGFPPGIEPMKPDAFLAMFRTDYREFIRLTRSRISLPLFIIYIIFVVIFSFLLFVWHSESGQSITQTIALDWIIGAGTVGAVFMVIALVKDTPIGNKRYAIMQKYGYDNVFWMNDEGARH